MQSDILKNRKVHYRPVAQQGNPPSRAQHMRSTWDNEPCKALWPRSKVCRYWKGIGIKMQEPQQNNNNDFMIEKIKDRPINRKKLLRRTLLTAAMAVIFGLIACFTFLVLEPVISNWLYPEEEPQLVVFPEDQEEMSPEEMLADIMQQEQQMQQQQIQQQIQQQLQQQPTSPEQQGTVLNQELILELLESVTIDVDDYRQMYMSLSEYANGLSQYMVTVTGKSSNIDWFNNIQESENQASGVIVANNGKELLVLVDYAPIREAETLSLTLYTGVQVGAIVKEQDKNTNLAILAVDLNLLDKDFLSDGLKIASLGTSALSNIVGTPVIALGRPMGTTGSIGYGMITAADIPINKADTNYKLMQTDIFGSENAGGILFNLHGQVVGIITTNHDNEDMKNIVSAYGISELKKRIEKMANAEKMAYLGISGVDVTKEAFLELGVPYGAYITEIEMDSPAMLAGIQQGDVLVKVDEKIIIKYSEYTAYLMQKKVGDTVKVSVMRQVQDEYKQMEFEVVLEEAR